MFRPSRVVGSAARLQVAIDDQVVGKTAGGTFLMVDVEPGFHRVSGRTSESNRGVTIQALADSAYFFKIWPKMGVFSSQSGVERMDAAEGRREVQSARMVVATWPTTNTSAR